MFVLLAWTIVTVVLNMKDGTFQRGGEILGFVRNDRRRYFFCKTIN